MTTSPAIELSQLVFGWDSDQPLLDIEHLCIGQGEQVFLRGPSASGKSTLLALIGGVLLPRSGSVCLLGTDIAALGAADRDRYRGDHLGFIFQMFNLIPYLDVLRNVLLPTAFSPSRRERIGADQEGEARRLLGALGLAADIPGRSVTQLSIGQQQRVAAARALLGQPEILIADEPTSALDADTREEFLLLLLKECRERNTTLLFVSHDMSLQSRFDRSLAMADINRVAAAR